MELLSDSFGSTPGPGPIGDVDYRLLSSSPIRLLMFSRWPRTQLPRASAHLSKWITRIAGIAGNVENIRPMTT